MLRTILNRKRLIIIPAGCAEGVEESWVEWVQRVTAEAREAMQSHGIPEWVDLQRSMLRQWGERVQHMDKYRWARRVFDWDAAGLRSRGHPRARWTDTFRGLQMAC